jgi:hypothetical protein
MRSLSKAKASTSVSNLEGAPNDTWNIDWLADFRAVVDDWYARTSDAYLWWGVTYEQAVWQKPETVNPLPPVEGPYPVFDAPKPEIAPGNGLTLPSPVLDKPEPGFAWSGDFGPIPGVYADPPVTSTYPVLNGNNSPNPHGVTTPQPVEWVVDGTLPDGGKWITPIHHAVGSTKSDGDATKPGAGLDAPMPVFWWPDETLTDGGFWSAHPAPPVAKPEILPTPDGVAKDVMYSVGSTSADLALI